MSVDDVWIGLSKYGYKLKEAVTCPSLAILVITPSKGFINKGLVYNSRKFFA
jgi:hypothetical protein